MMQTYWTLTYAGVEQSFAAIGFSDPVQNIYSQGKSTFTVKVPGIVNLLASPPVPYFGLVKIKKYPLGGSPVTVFQGRQVTNKTTASMVPAQSLVFMDAWHDMSITDFQQQWNYKLPNGTYLYGQPTARFNLFQPYYGSNTDKPLSFTVAAGGTGYSLGDILTAIGGTGLPVSVMVTALGPGGSVATATVFGAGAYTTPPSNPVHFSGGTGSGAQLTANGSWQQGIMTAGQQLIEALNWAITCGIQIQVGAVNLPWLLPVYPAKGMKISAVIQACMKPSPDAVCWLDHSTTPPTFNCTQRPSLTPITLPYGDGATHVTSDLTPRYDLLPNEVMFQYLKPFTVNGQTINSYYTDYWPPSATGKQIGGIIVPIDLAGGKMSFQTIQTVASQFDPTDTTYLDTSNNYWWQIKKPEWKNVPGIPSQYYDLTLLEGKATVTVDGTDFQAVVVNGVVISDPQGILTSYPNESVGDDPPAWAGFTVVPCTVKAKFTYNRRDLIGGRIVEDIGPDGHEVNTRVKLTNAPLGTQTFTQTNISDYGEYPIFGLAENIYNTMSILAWEGAHRIVEVNSAGQPDAGSVLGPVGPQNSLNLSGGLAAWLTMNATIQTVTIDHYRGTTDIHFGPPKHIAPGEMNEMAQFYRYRWPLLNAAARQTGEMI